MESKPVEYFTPEGCHILESWNVAGDAAASIARARVEPGVTTQPHRLCTPRFTPECYEAL